MTPLTFVFLGFLFWGFAILFSHTAPTADLTFRDMLAALFALASTGAFIAAVIRVWLT